MPAHKEHPVPGTIRGKLFRVLPALKRMARLCLVEYQGLGHIAPVIASTLGPQSKIEIFGTIGIKSRVKTAFFLKG